MKSVRAVVLLLALAGLSNGSAPSAGLPAQEGPGQPGPALRAPGADGDRGNPGAEGEAGVPRAPGAGRQILGGAAYGGSGLLLGGAAGAALFSAGCAAWGEDCGFSGLAGAFFGGALGFAGGFPFGVYRFGNDASVSGSLGWTYLSAAIGSAAGFGAWAAATRLRNEDAVFQSMLLGLAGAPIGAMIGYNATRPSERAPRVAVFPQGKDGWACRLSWSFAGPR